jgi:hypothetical protein
MQINESTNSGAAVGSLSTEEPQVHQYEEQVGISGPGVVPATPEQIKAFRDSRFKKGLYSIQYLEYFISLSL